MKYFTILVAVVLASFGVGQCAHAQQDAANQSVEAGREALKKSARYPWYDSETDDLRDINAKEKKSDDSETRKSGWEAQQSTQQPTARTTTPITGYGWVAQLVQILAMIVLGMLIAALIFFMIRYFLKEEEGSLDRGMTSFNEQPREEVDRVEQLPFNLRKPMSDLLTEARRLYELGRYDEAIIYYYSYMMVELDKHQHLRLAIGKTNRQYLRELHANPNLAEMLRGTMIVFEDVFFGHYELSRHRFEQCWQRQAEFENALEHSGIAA